MSSKRGRTVRRRLQGVAFLVVLAALLGLSVAFYNKAFADVATVTLKTDTAGNQLQEASDVKVRGVIVGEVRDVKADLDGATITLAINPQYLPEIPDNVTARLLPKTLFGERFVSLVPPQDPSTKPLADGAVIGQDRTKDAIELQKVIDDLLPLLQAVPPQDLSYTLGAVADALRGRGDRLGENLVSTGTYVGQINTVLPQLQADISGLADVSDTYNSAADDLLAVLDNLSITNSTIVDQAEQLKRTFTVVGSSATTGAQFLEQNESSLISLAETSRPVLGVFAKYSPEYPCLLNGLTRFEPMISEAFGADGDPALNLNISVSLPPRNPYQPGDQPAYLDKSGPDCRGLTNIDAIIAAAQHGEYYCPTPPADGVDSTDNPVSGNPHCIGGSGPNDVPAGAGNPNASPTGSAGQSANFSLAGSTAELDFVKSILGYQTGTDPGDVSDLAASTMAPFLRGTQVVIP
ncbi:MCE family protein [Petropleomorpha daqingensis]|uniref:Virulence factor Mce-like protein n=1 Tax=Petropleomorpha daqingensis TaxID=2026353 RepID=A0A853CA55_9ACTN|nr:MCE family protein [Petropleomorpha daqingensis]NYJ04825.1 virulence factor Mce-like protein [Petropleomorpha daqingensis]